MSVFIVSSRYRQRILRLSELYRARCSAIVLFCLRPRLCEHLGRQRVVKRGALFLKPRLDLAAQLAEAAGKIRLADTVEILIYQLVGQCKAADDSAAVACDYDLVHDLALADGEHRILKLLDKLPVCKAIAAESSAVLRKVGQQCSRLCLGEHRLGILLITRQDILGIVKILVCVLDKSSIVDGKLSAALARQSVAQLLLKLLKLERAAEEISRQIRLTQLRVKLLSTAALLLGSRDGIVDRLLLVVRQIDLLFLSQLIYRCAVTQRRSDRILKLLRTVSDRSDSESSLYTFM